MDIITRVQNKNRDVFRIFNFDPEVCLKLIKKVFRYPLTGARYPLIGARYPLIGARYPLSGARYPLTGARYPLTGARYPLSTFSSHDLFIFTFGYEDFQIVSYIYNPPEVKKS